MCPSREAAARLASRDREVAADILAEAEEIARRPHAIAEDVDRRATTLQGAVAIATTFTLAGASLILDQTKIECDAWRVGFALVFAGVVFSFVASGLRALGASSRTHPWFYPAHNDILNRENRDLAASRVARAATLLKTAGHNERISKLKAGYLNAAVRWFRVALALLLFAAILLLVDAITS